MNARPWYRHRWLWLLIAIPAIGIAMSIITATFAVRGADTDVRDGVHVPLDKSSWRQQQEPGP